MRNALWTILLAASAAMAAATEGNLRAGAARIDITPGEKDGLKMDGYPLRVGGQAGVHDSIYVRAIALDNGNARAGIVTADLVGFSHTFWARVSQRMAEQTGIPRENIFLVATHTHAAPAIGTYGGAGTDAKQAEYIKRVEDSLVQVLVEARKNLQPARIGAATGRANVNVNRRALMADGLWGVGSNPDGPSDKTVAVVRIENAQREPLAIFVNYGVHGTAMGGENNMISGDLPGLTSQYVEQHFGDKVIVPWTSGAAGDQGPIYDTMVLPKNFRRVAAMARILGEEVIRVSGEVWTTPFVSIQGGQKAITCPGRKMAPGPRPAGQFEFVDAAPLEIRLSALKINDIALGGVSGEVFSLIGQRFKRESPVAHTIMITHCNGSSGYIPNDDAYAQVGYEVQVTGAKPGCAEKAITDGLIDLIR